MRIIQKNLKVFLFLVAILIATAGYTQVKTITGKVTDVQTGEPLPGVTIIVQGTTIGTATNFDGDYSLNVEPNQVLSFSFIGYTSKEITVGAESVINVQMELSMENLDEVIVIGYGQVKKEDATGSVTAVNSEDFNVTAMSNPAALVTGKIAGVQITPGGGAPGEGPTIRIRGGSSLSASNSPLYVIDGVPLEGTGVSGQRSGLTTINSTDIETFTVLKDASATAIYGSRASNGVIIITTKKGRKGEGLHVNYNGFTSLSVKSGENDILSADEFRKAVIDEKGADSEAAKLLDMYPGVKTNWQDEIFEPALSTDHNVSLTGNIQNMPFRASVGYTNENGILKTTGMERGTATLGFNPSFFEDHLRFNLNLKGMLMKNNFGNQGAIGSAVSFDPTKPVDSGSSKYGGYFTWLQPNGDPNTLAPSNPVALLMLHRDESNVKRSIGNLQTDYRFHFLPELNATLNLGYDISYGEGTVVETNDAPWTIANDGGYFREYTQDKKNTLLDFYLNYVKDIESINSKIDVMGGYSWQHFWKEDYSFATNGSGSEIISPKYSDPTESYLVSFFGRLNYTFMERYLLTVTVRQDGTSRFSPDTRWGTFPSAALAWQIKDEPWLANAKNLSDLKLRLGYGITGQQNISNNDYPYLPRYTLSADNARYQFGDEFVYTFRPEGYDANIKWEETVTYNIGLDYGFIDNRISGAIDVYYRQTNDLINFIPVPAGTNLTNQILTNVGNMKNNGVEFSINAIPVSKPDISWEIGFNATYQNTEITKLTATDDPSYLGVFTGGISGAVGNMIQIHTVGYPPNSFFVYEQVYDENQKPIQGLYVDRNGDGQITGDDRYRYKKAAPDVFMGFNTKLFYKKWDFGLNGRINIGNYVYNNNWSAGGYLGNLYWSTGYMNNIPVNALDTRFQNPQYFSDYYIKDASFLRVDNINLGYTLRNFYNENMSARFYLSAQNVFVITKYEGLDPEVFSGIDNNIYPRPRIFMMGVNINF